MKILKSKSIFIFGHGGKTKATAERFIFDSNVFPERVDSTGDELVIKYISSSLRMEGPATARTKFFKFRKEESSFKKLSLEESKFFVIGNNHKFIPIDQTLHTINKYDKELIFNQKYSDSAYSVYKNDTELIVMKTDNNEIVYRSDDYLRFTVRGKFSLKEIKPEPIQKSATRE